MTQRIAAIDLYYIFSFTIIITNGIIKTRLTNILDSKQGDECIGFIIMCFWVLSKYTKNIRKNVTIFN